MTDPIEAVSYYLIFVLSTTLHEAAHAWAAKLGGDLTAYHGGQVSLDPRPHIRREPFGMVILPVLTVVISGWPLGFASAPYDPLWAQRHPRRAAWMALAGPGANLGLLLLAAILIRGGEATGLFTAPESIAFGSLVTTEHEGIWRGAGMLLGMFFSLNLVLFVLNVIPLPPLDGSAAMPLVLSPSAAERYREFLQQPMLGWAGLLVAWWILHAVFQPLFLVAVNLLWFPLVQYG